MGTTNSSILTDKQIKKQNFQESPEEVEYISGSYAASKKSADIKYNICCCPEESCKSIKNKGPKKIKSKEKQKNIANDDIRVYNEKSVSYSKDGIPSQMCMCDGKNVDKTKDKKAKDEFRKSKSNSNEIYKKNSQIAINLEVSSNKTRKTNEPKCLSLDLDKKCICNKQIIKESMR